MENGYKHKTAMFGSSAENYVSRLFMMMKNPNGHRRPDLISIDQRYNPILSLEVKSGAKKKGILVDYQLHYSITTTQAYKELFGEYPPKRTVQTELFGKNGVIQTDRLIPGDPIAYYYCVIDRTDKLRSTDLDKPYSTIKCQWGDLFLVPAEFAFNSFVACRVKRTGEKPKKVIKELKEVMKRDALNWKAFNYDQRKGHLYSWQNIHGRDILAVFENDLSLATVNGRKRIQLIEEHYPGSSNLKRVKVPGPNRTSIYILASPEDKTLFDVQVRNTINQRTPILEKVARQRKRAVPLLWKVLHPRDPSFFPEVGVEAAEIASQTMTLNEIRKLERLVNWLDVRERKEDFVPF